jgi:hypothetical protein
MSKIKLTQFLRFLILPVMLLCLISSNLMGCGTTQYTIPPLRDKAVLNLPLDQEPTLPLTKEQALKIYHASPDGMRAIIKNQARWAGYAEIAKSLKQSYDDYLKEIFTPVKPVKKWWQFWR